MVHAAPAAADVLTDFFPPETKVVFGVRVHNLAVSGIVQKLSQQVQAQAQAGGANWLRMVSVLGFDPLHDIDEAMMASGAAGQNPPVLIVVAGRFDVARMAEGARRYHDVPLLGGDKDTDSVVALLDGSTALAGDANMVRAAIDRRGGGVHIDSDLNDRITSLRQRYDIWGLGERPQGFAAPTPEAKSLESIDRFQFGIQLESGLELSAEIHARSTKDAEKLNETLQMVAAMLKGQKPSAGGAKFDLEAEGGTIKLNVSIPEAELKKMITSEKAALTPQMPTTAPAPDSRPTAWGSDVSPEPPLTVPAAGPALSPVVPADPPSAVPALSPAAPADVPAVPAIPAVAPADPPSAVPAAPAAAPADPPKETAKAASKAAASQVTDRQGNTIVLQLPGKK